MAIVNFDECALVIMLVFNITSMIRREYRTRTNKIMLAMQWTIFISIFADFLSAHLINTGHTESWIRITVWIANYVYFFFHNLILALYMLYVFSSVDIWHLYHEQKKNRIFMVTLVAVNTIVLALNGVVFNVFTITNDVKYVRGPWIAVFYVSAALFGIWVFRTLVGYRRIINKDKLSVLLFLFIIIVGALLIQLINGDMLVEGFSMALAVLFYMVLVKKEEEQVDPITGAIRYTEGIDRAGKSFVTKKPLSYIFVKILNHNNIRLYLGAGKFNALLRATTAHLYEIANSNNFSAEVFYMENGLFCVMGSDIDKTKVSKVATDCYEQFSKEDRFEGFTVIADMSVCVAYSPEDFDDVSTLLTFITSYDQTISDARGLHFYGDLRHDKEFRIRVELEEILRRALDHNGISMYYQPIYSIMEKRYVAAEALIRLRDKIYGNISPAIFIPMAEASGTIHEIGDYVLNEVTNFISSIDMDELGLKYIEINLSSSQCIELDLVDKIMETLERKNIDPERVSFELTEAATGVNPEIVDINIRKLHDNGIRIALDDYGTGYSNIKRVTQLPIDEVKLDRTFIDMIDEPDMWIVIRDTVAMLKEMGKEILVEGVEEKKLAEKISELDADLVQGCELMQGYLFCQPLPKDEFVEFIKNNSNYEGMDIV